jgi:hypothetical protein
LRMFYAEEEEDEGGSKFSAPLVTLAETIMSPSSTSLRKSAPSTTYPKLCQIKTRADRKGWREHG